MLYIFRNYNNFCYLLPINLDVSYIVFEDCWHIDLWELVFTEDNEKAGLSAGSVAHNNQFLTNGGHINSLSGGTKTKRIAYHMINRRNVISN